MINFSTCFISLHKRHWMFSLFICAACSVFAQQDSLTINKAIEIVLDRHPSVIQVQEALAAAQEHSQSLKSAYYPSVNSSVSYAYVGPDQTLTIPGMGSFSLFPQNNYDGHVSVSYTVFDFGKRSTNLETGKVGEASAKDRAQQVKTNLMYQVIHIYSMINLEEKSLRIANEALEELGRHLLVVKKKLETGSATEYDTLKTQVQLTNAMSQKIDIANDMAKQQTILRQLLGFKEGSPLLLKEVIDTLAPQINSDSLVRYALENRSERSLALRAKESAHLQKESIKKENLPIVKAQAEAGFKNGILPDINSPTFDWTLAAQITMPLFDGFHEKRSENEASRNEQAAAAGINDAEERIKTNVIQAEADVEASYSKLDISRSQLNFAQRSLELARIKYDAGVITNVDVLDAENELSQAKLGHLQNQYRYFMSKHSLDQATGAFPAAR